MSAALPPALRAGIEALAGRFPGRALAEASQRLSADYRAGRGTRFIHAVDTAAYATARLPATYAAVAAALAEASLRTAFTPASVLDLGCGPGTASWAALEAFPDVGSVRLVDSHAGMIGLGQDLARQGPPALRDAGWRQAGIPAALAGAEPADLVIASYALNELDGSELDRVAAAMLSRSTGLVIVVEPGTKAGFAVIGRVRSALIAAGARLLAPCPSNGACPVSAPDWCHFSVRLPRLRAHRAAKGADVPFEDEPFAYLVAARPEIAGSPADARILRPPRATRAGTDFALCTPAGATPIHVPARDRERTRLTRRLGWGDAFLTCTTGN
ncbi:small ribosomal subunit Rsm22 family protein [Phreatobacter sp.]|uniref:small ribosomal subunit Rsm22 family protein n=1 Tax=Phreatobacter sp. TaxID=1966341 RepID=UPI003F71CDD9